VENCTAVYYIIKMKIIVLSVVRKVFLTLVYMGTSNEPWGIG